MPTVVLYVATSLDGFIARSDGAVDWLFTDGEYGYSAFYESVDALVMGSRTYEQVLTFGPWPYPGKPTYVFTRRALKTGREDVVFVSGEPADVLDHLAGRGLDRIWLVGGAGLVASFRDAGLIDEYILSIHPILLGDGIPLFSAPAPEEGLEFVGSEAYASGLLQVCYRRRGESS
jgi:dihydrofolate reductase